MTASFILPDGTTATEIHCSGAQTPRVSAERIVWMENEIERLRLRNDELYGALQRSAAAGNIIAQEAIREALEAARDR